MRNFLIIFSIIGLLFWSSCSSDLTKSKTVDFLVAYGNPPAPGGVCTGGGICMRVAAGTTPIPPKSVKSTFSHDATQPTQITVSFLKSEIVAADPDHAAYLDKLIATPSLTYVFPNAHPLSDVEFSNMGLKPTAKIVGNIPAKVSFNASTGRYTVIYNITQ